MPRSAGLPFKIRLGSNGSQYVPYIVTVALLFIGFSMYWGANHSHRSTTTTTLRFKDKERITSSAKSSTTPGSKHDPEAALERDAHTTSLNAKTPDRASANLKAVQALVQQRLGIPPAVLHSFLQAHPAQAPDLLLTLNSMLTNLEPDLKEIHGDELDMFQLPTFQPQLDHLVSQMRLALTDPSCQGSPVLLEGPSGVGKGLALEYLVADLNKSRQVAVYLSLNRRLPSASTSDEDTRPSQRPSLHSAILSALGYDPELQSSPAESVGLLEKTLKFLADNNRTPLICVDDLQILFADEQPLHEDYAHIEVGLQWLMECVTGGSIQVLLCSSSKTVFRTIKEKIPGYDFRLKLRTLTSIDDTYMAEYLVDSVNAIMPEPHLEFTPELAQLFVDTFGSNLLELKRYIKAERPLHEYISGREQDLLAMVEQSAAGLFAGRAATYHDPESELRNVILDTMMRGGTLPVKTLDGGRLAMVEVLVELNWLKWRVKKSKPLASRSPSSQVPTTTGQPNNVSGEQRRKLQGGRRKAEKRTQMEQSWIKLHKEALAWGMDSVSGASAWEEVINSEGRVQRPVYQVVLDDPAQESTEQSDDNDNDNGNDNDNDNDSDFNDATDIDRHPRHGVDGQAMNHDRHHEFDRLEDQDDDDDDDSVPLDDPMSMFSREGAELVWSNRLIQTACERWFNQERWQ
ncbi:uncharacterized protein BJ171DRAFT_566343 [Polychytrium aggregatum]|uniref:uncharacterized protein n=1 Tax=Polychytrium aggregatum TaxID=110093 RepID=UPI0022FE7C03|nr:uncharacterized protein BJ171DRAFT_566343 [Polychytrium aggregatum]KAI9206991.1 hypothetical protein BJ171DRAFT_566343 [Polychytrium aggregatum]